MKNLFTIIVILAVLMATTLWLISDRDRGLWLLTNALKIAHPLPSNENLAYGDQAWQTLDVYPQVKSSPVIIFIHGGSWHHGRKEQYRFAADAFYRLGYTVVLPDYIKHPNKEARYPSFATDAAKAIGWVKHNIGRYNGDSSNLFLVGHSAGAHTALMVTTDLQFLKAEGLSEKDIRAVAGIAGPYSFIPDEKITQTVFGPPENYPLMNALNYVDGNEPSTLLLHSKSDTQVGQYNQAGLAKKLNDSGIDVETILYEKLNHVDMVTHLHPWFNRNENVSDDIDRFFKARLK